MPKVTKFAKGSLVRPFLDFSREQLQSYAKRHRLTWIEDESNLSAAFDRNFLRLHILPLLKNRWPGMLTTITRSAAHLAEANLLLDDLAARDLVKVRGKAPNTLSIAKLQALNLALQRNLIRYWLTKLALPLPSSKKLEQIIKCILPSKSDACPLVNWRGVEIRRFAGDIYAMLPLAKHDTNKRLKWDQKKPLKLPANLGILSAEPLNATAANNKHWPQRVTVGFRSGGEKITLLGHKHAKTLKNLFQEWRIPPWQRERIPLVYFENKLVAVVGYGVGELGRDWVFMLVED